MVSKDIFLEKNRNVKSLNKENTVNLSLEQKARLLPFDDVSDTLNLYQLYSDERDACTKYRLIFTVNALCSNVLYNMKTEVVKDEGSDNCECAPISNLPRTYRYVNPTYPVTHLQLIRDTEYSCPDADYGNYTYHCGVDMFNNHMLRAKGLNYIPKYDFSSGYNTSGPVFNTIKDFKRDSDGNIIREKLAPYGDTLTQIHQYRVDNIMSMSEAFNAQVEEKDGWIGFSNRTTLNIPNHTDGRTIINKVINNKKACEFIDLYPDRSLFSFIPKVNKTRKRLEYNWDYCITYPYKSDKEKFEQVMQLSENAIRCHYEKSDSTDENERRYYIFTTCIKHNLKYGDRVRIFSGEEFDEVDVQGLGNASGQDKEHCFKVYVNTFKINIENSDKIVGVQKIVAGNDCTYYFRKFKKILVNGKLPDSSVSKLAYGENIYGDRLAQIIYTDDIDINGLRDNLGRPLTEMYLTVVKTNRGYKEWYESGITSASTIEYSHCFGKVTSGIDMGNFPGATYNNIRKMHNVDATLVEDTEHYLSGFVEVFGDNCMAFGGLEDNIKLDGMDDFYGDIVEFDPTTNSETVLEKVYHRVNTAQRECLKNTNFYDINYDDLIGDDYNTITEKKSGIRTGSIIALASQYPKLNITKIDHLPTQATSLTLTLLSQLNNRSWRIVKRPGWVSVSKISGTTSGSLTEKSDTTVITIQENTSGYPREGEIVVLFPGTGTTAAITATCTVYQTTATEFAVAEEKLNTTASGNLFPGNIQLEGYYYQPHHRIPIREIASVTSTSLGYKLSYDGLGLSEVSVGEDTIYRLQVNGPSEHKYVPDSLFGVILKNGEIYWHYLYSINNIGGLLLEPADQTKAFTDIEELGQIDQIVLCEEIGVPTYASYNKKEQMFVWREVLDYSRTDENSEVGDAIFTNGAIYKHMNINFEMKRQDPFGEYGVQYQVTAPSVGGKTAKTDVNPLRVFKKKGMRVDLSQLIYLPIEAENACL